MAQADIERPPAYDFVFETALRNWTDYWSWFFPPGVRAAQAMLTLYDLVHAPPEGDMSVGHIEE